MKNKFICTQYIHPNEDAVLFRESWHESVQTFEQNSYRLESVYGIVTLDRKVFICKENITQIYTNNFAISFLKHI